MNQETKNGFQKISITHSQSKDQRKSIFSSYESFVFVCAAYDERFTLQAGFLVNKATIKNVDDMILQGSHKMRSSLRDEVMRKEVVVEVVK